MTRLRWLLLAGMLGSSLTLAFFLRDIVYDVVVVPLAYLLWLGKYYYTAIPQIILWMILLVILFVTVALNFVPEARPSRRQERIRKTTEGQVEALAVWIHKARKSNYFKWQLANRLGRITRRINELTGRQVNSGSNKEAVEKYLDAGLNNSFVDFATPKNRFRHSIPTPLDLDPKDAVDYLESQMELRSDRHS
jgi:uncharacterized membrane protein